MENMDYFTKVCLMQTHLGVNSSVFNGKSCSSLPGIGVWVPEGAWMEAPFSKEKGGQRTSASIDSQFSNSFLLNLYVPCSHSYLLPTSFHSWPRLSYVLELGSSLLLSDLPDIEF